jgi:hypothetical protein
MSAYKLQATVIKECFPAVNKFRKWHMKNRARNTITVTLLWVLEWTLLYRDLFIRRPSGVETNHVNTKEILFNRLELIYGAVQFVSLFYLTIIGYHYILARLSYKRGLLNDRSHAVE